MSAPAVTGGAWTTANTETAMCLWEAALELRERLPELQRSWRANGTSAMRHAIMALVDECEASWEAARVAGTENEPYDWEHCPAFLIERFGPLAEPAGTYRPELVAAFRDGARALAAAALPDKLEVNDDAVVRECEGDGVLVQCWLYVHDTERASMAGEATS